MENTLFSGSLSLTEILESAKRGHSAFAKAANGKIYFNVALWLNAEKDKFDNDMSIQLSSKKEMREKEGNIYIGNARKFEKQNPQPLAQDDINNLDTQDLPF